MFKGLTLQQFCALDCKRNMVVTSGPGAGKTRILSHRFCFILLTDDYVSLPQILTLTFTEKAAEEMKSRIYEMLVRLEKQLEKAGEDPVTKRIREARVRFHMNRISTIHSFCAQLLREHPVESGVDPGYVIIQGARRRNLMELSIETAMSSVWARNKELLMPLFQSFGGRDSLLRSLRNVIDHPITFERIKSTKERLFETEGWLRQVFSDYCAYLRDANVIPYLKGLRNQDNGKPSSQGLKGLLDGWQHHAERDHETFGMPGLFRELRQIYDKRRPYNPLPTVRDGMRKISYVDLIDEFYPDIFDSRSTDIVFEKELNTFLKVAEICMEQYKREKVKGNLLDFADLESKSYSFLLSFYENSDRSQLDRIQNKYKYIMVDEFQDTNRVQWDIIRMLSSCKNEGGKEILLPGKLFVVGDERQAIYRFRGGDVTLFGSVTDKICVSNPQKPARMFWQDKDISRRMTRIYKEYPEIVKRYKENFSSLPHPERKDIMKGSIYLPHNFRSDQQPVVFFNRAFREIFSNKGAERLEKYETAPKIISIPEGERLERENRGSVTLYLARVSSKNADQTEAEAALIVDIIERIMGRYGKENHEYNTYPDIREKITKRRAAIGILFFTFLHLKVFENILREAGLPFKVYRGKGFFRCEEVMEMLQLLNYIADKRQKISLLSVLRSPIFGFTDPELFDLFYSGKASADQFQTSVNSYIRNAGDLIESWRLLSRRLTISGLIRTIIADRSLTALYSVHPNGLQRMANIEKLIDIARRYQSEGNGSLPEFVRYCLQMADEEEEEGEALIISGEESPISLMTIHASKGLEFPMVIIPELDRRLPARRGIGRPVRFYSRGDGRPGYWNYMEGEIPVWPIEVPELDYARKYSPLGYLLMKRDRLEDIAEGRRVFYVGCTRARNHLILVSSIKKGIKKNEKRDLTSGDYRERATILDLLEDIYGCTLNFTPERSNLYTEGPDGLSIIWREPEIKIFKGSYYGKEGSDSYSLGVYDQRIKGIDLTGSIQAPRYLQLSFNSLRIFKKCPVKFYFNVVLGVRAGDQEFFNSTRYGQFMEAQETIEGNEGEYSSENALFLGKLVHEYLEKHHFGDPLNEELLQTIWERLGDPAIRCHSLEKDEMLNLRKKAFRQLKHTVHDKRLIKILGEEACYAEIPFLFSVSSGIEFRGVIDRLFKSPDKDGWTIIDWKSNDLGGREPEEVAEENGYHLQLACYKGAVEHILNEKVGRLYIYFTDKGYLLESGRQTDSKDIFEEMLGKIKKYEGKSDTWISDHRKMRRVSKECLSCEYREGLCKAGREAS